MVAAQHDGQPPLLQRLPDGIVRNLVPGDALGQVAHARRIARAARIGRAGQVADVVDLHAQLGQGRAQLGHAQGIGPHGRAQA